MQTWVAFLLLGITILFIGAYLLINYLTKNALSSKLSICTNFITKYILKIYQTKYFWPIFIILLFLLNLTLYSIFSLPLAKPNGPIYIEGGSIEDAKHAATLGREIIKTWNLVPISIFGWSTIAFVLVYFFYCLKTKKLTFAKSIVLVILIGSIVRIVYANTTDSIFTRQYDVWSSSYYGHYGIIMNIYNHFAPPPLRSEIIDGVMTPTLDASYQMYHPKFSHYLYAISMHIHSLFFGTNNADWTLYQSIRITTSMLTIGTLIIGYYALSELTNNKTMIFVGTVFLASAPLLIRLSASTNNDTLLYFCMTAAILFMIRFYKKQSWSNTIFLALSIGFAMGSKLSGALIAVPTAIIFIIVFIKMIKEKRWAKGLLTFAVFFAICCPIGLFWPIFNKVNYGQDLTYIWARLNHNLEIPSEIPYANRYLYFPIDQYFANLWMQLWKNNTSSPLDYNLYSSMIKSSIFGEFSYSSSTIAFASMLFIGNFVLFTSICLIGIYLIIKSYLKKKYMLLAVIGLPVLLYFSIVLILGKEVWMYVVSGLFICLMIYLIILANKQKELLNNYLGTILVGGIFMLFMISYFMLQVKNPYTCSQDFRYVGLFYFVGAYFIGLLFSKTNSKELRILQGLTLGFYVIPSIMFYISIGF